MYRIGVDLGGTNIAVGVVDEEYNIVSKVSVKTGLPCSAESIADKIAGAVFEAAEKASIDVKDAASVGIGSPGLINGKAGVVRYANNLQFDNVYLSDMVSERLDFPRERVFLENDANAAAFGEFLAGSGRGTTNFIAVTLGTGVGGGIIINGKPYSGSNGAGGEIGHMIVNAHGKKCSCGMQGCWEVYASVNALIERTKEGMLQNRDSIMWKFCGNSIDNVTGLTAFDAMRAGDICGIVVVNEYLKDVSIGLASLVTIFQPDKIAVGGGISAEGETLLKPIRDRLESFNCTKGATLGIALLGNDAGIIGAAFLS